MRDTERTKHDLVGLFPEPEPVIKLSGSELTGHQEQCRAVMASICCPDENPRPRIANVDGVRALCKVAKNTLLNTGHEGQDMRFVAFKLWKGIERRVLSSEASNTSKLEALDELKRFDRSMLPHLSDRLTPAQKALFVEAAIKHLAWLANEGFKSGVHFEVAEHAIGLLKKSLPEALEQASPEYKFHKRLETVLSLVIRNSIEMKQGSKQVEAWRIAADIAKLPLPPDKVNLAADIGALLCELRDSAPAIEEPGIYLSDLDSEKTDPLKLTPPVPKLAEDSFSQVSQDLPQKKKSGRSMFTGRSREKQDGSDSPYNELGATLIKHMLRYGPQNDKNFWQRFLNETSMSDPLWISGMHGLAQTNIYDFDYYTKRLLIAAAQNDAATLNLMRLALDAESLSWKSGPNFKEVLRDVCQSVEESTRLRARANIYMLSFKYERNDNRKTLVKARGILYGILTQKDDPKNHS